MAIQTEPEIEEAPLFTCGCGESGAVEDMLSPDDLEQGCAGTGVVQCFCGGDFCVCHFHGETDCDGCEDCDLGGDDSERGADAFAAGECAHGTAFDRPCEGCGDEAGDDIL
jgi:hypothetical protein